MQLVTVDCIQEGVTAGRGLNQRDDRCLVSVEFEIIGIGVRASSPNISHQNVGVRYPRGSVGKKYLEDLGKK
jgi:hypothetical protein